MLHFRIISCMKPFMLSTFQVIIIIITRAIEFWCHESWLPRSRLWDDKESKVSICILMLRKWQCLRYGSVIQSYSLDRIIKIFVWKEDVKKKSISLSRNRLWIARLSKRQHNFANEVSLPLLYLAFSYFPISHQHHMLHSLLFHMIAFLDFSLFHFSQEKISTSREKWTDVGRQKAVKVRMESVSVWCSCTVVVEMEEKTNSHNVFFCCASWRKRKGNWI